MINIHSKKDGHVHSSYCPHGTKDSMESYVQRAIGLGLNEMTFTEHMPLPDGVLEPSLQRECALKMEQLVPYFKEIDLLKEKYKGQLRLNKGLEVDYIEDYEEATKEILNKCGGELEDGLLSVHILKLGGRYYCIDMSPEEYGRLIALAGGLTALYDHYYQTLLKAIKADLGPFKPRRIGHPTLPRIFNLKYPLDYQNKTLLEKVIIAIKDGGYQIDLNTAGLRKPFCKEAYPSGVFLELARKYHIPMVFGSDAHMAKDVASAFTWNKKESL